MFPSFLLTCNDLNPHRCPATPHSPVQRVAHCQFGVCCSQLTLLHTTAVALLCALCRLDMDRFNAAQNFFEQHAMSLTVSWFCSLTIGFAIPTLLDALVFTTDSNSPEKALKRYLATAQHIFQWHQGDIFDCTSCDVNGPVPNAAGAQCSGPLLQTRAVVRTRTSAYYGNFKAICYSPLVLSLCRTTQQLLKPTNRSKWFEVCMQVYVCECAHI